MSTLTEKVRDWFPLGCIVTVTSPYSVLEPGTSVLVTGYDEYELDGLRVVDLNGRTALVWATDVALGVVDPDAGEVL